MTILSLSGDPNGTGTVTIAAPNTNTSRTISLPDASTTMVGTDTTQTLTNKTLGTGLVAAASLITQVAAQTATGTAVEFTGIPSWVKRITVMFNGVSLSANADILVQIGPSGGAEITGYTSACTAFAGGSLGSASSTAGFNLSAGLAAVVVSGHMVITNVTGSLWVASHAVGRTDSAGARVGGGAKTITGTLAVVRITSTATDTFDAGSIGLLYE